MLSVFVAFYAVHGVLRERKYELYVQILAILVILVYCIAEYSVNTKRHNDVKLVGFSWYRDYPHILDYF